MPNDASTSSIGSNDAKEGSAGFNTTRLQVPKLRIKKLCEGGPLNATPCGWAGGEHRGLAHLGLLRMNPTPVTVIGRKSRNKEAGGAGVRVGYGPQVTCDKRARGSGVRPEHATPSSVERPEGRRAGVFTLIRTDAASVDNKWLELQFKTPNVDVVAVNETWLRTGEGDSNLV